MLLQPFCPWCTTSESHQSHHKEVMKSHFFNATKTSRWTSISACCPCCQRRIWKHWDLLRGHSCLHFGSGISGLNIYPFVSEVWYKNPEKACGYQEGCRHSWYWRMQDYHLHAWIHWVWYSQCFAGNGKAKALMLLTKNKLYRGTFLQLGEQWELSLELMNQLENFTCWIYPPKAPISKVNNFRYHLFCGKMGENRLPSVTTL